MPSILAFFLGFLFGIIVLVGAVAGGVFFALNYKLDKISANKDGDGNYIYINADSENGGVKNALELFKKITELSKNTSSLTLGEIENLLPIASKLTDSIDGILSQYVELDMDELKQVEFSALGAYMQDVVMDLQPASLLEKFMGGDFADNVIMKTILYDGDGNPVTLRAFAEGDALDALYEKKVVDLAGADDELSNKILGEVTVGDLVNGGVNFNDILNGLTVPDFVEVDPSNKLLVYFAYGITELKNSGGEYTGMYSLSEGEKVPCRLETEVSENGAAKISAAYYTDADGSRVEIAGTTIQDVSERTENLMDELTVSDIIHVNAPVEGNYNTIMIFLAYSVSDITAEQGDGYSYTGVFNFEDGSTKKCYIFNEGAEVSDICFYEDGEYVSVQKTSVSNVAKQVNRLTATLKIKDVVNISPTDKLMSKLGEYKISEVGNAVNDLALNDFIEITYGAGGASETVLAYMAYGVTDIKAGDGFAVGEYYTHSGTLHEIGGGVRDCYIVCTDGVITKVFIEFDGQAQEVQGTKINQVNERVSGITNDLTIGELMEVDEGNIFLKAISGSTISSLAGDISKLSVNELYAENIYSSSKDASGEKVEIYLAVNDVREATQYSAGVVYYVYSDVGYSLASTTGKLSVGQFDELNSAGQTLYTAGEGKILFDSAFLYYTYDAEKDKYTLVNSGADDAGKLSALGSGEYYTYGAANAMWKLLLYSGGSETAFSVNGLTTMITNVSANIQNSTMRELDEAGIVDMGENLEKRLNWTANGQPHSEIIGDLTLRELLDAVIAISDMLGNMPLNG